MSLSILNKVKAIEDRNKPEQPFRVQLAIMGGSFKDPSKKVGSRFIENKAARDQRYKLRLDAGIISPEEYKDLCKDPLPNGAFDMPDVDKRLLNIT